MNDSITQEDLTPAGRKRRQEMRTALQQQLHSIHRQRRHRRFVTLLTSMIVVCCAVLWLNFADVSGTSRTIDLTDNLGELRRQAAKDRIVKQYVCYSRSDVVERYVVEDKTADNVQLQEFSDPDELLDMLATAGHPANLARVGGELKVILTPREESLE